MHLPDFTDDQITEFLIWFKNNERTLQNDPAFQQNGIALLNQYAENPEFNSHIQSTVMELAREMDISELEALPACSYLAGMVTGFMMAKWHDDERINKLAYGSFKPADIQIIAGDQAKFKDKVE